MRFGFIQSLQFAAVAGAQNSWVWVLRMCSKLETAYELGPRRAAEARLTWLSDGMNGRPASERANPAWGHYNSKWTGVQ